MPKLILTTEIEMVRRGWNLHGIVPILAFAINRLETPVSEIRDIISKVLMLVILIKSRYM